MAKELSVLQQQAEAITTEVNKGANTSSRIGGMFSDMLDYNEEKLTELEGSRSNIFAGGNRSKRYIDAGYFDFIFDADIYYSNIKDGYFYFLSSINKSNKTFSLMEKSKSDPLDLRTLLTFTESNKIGAYSYMVSNDRKSYVLVDWELYKSNEIISGTSYDEGLDLNPCIFNKVQFDEKYSADDLDNIQMNGIYKIYGAMNYILLVRVESEYINQVRYYIYNNEVRIEIRTYTKSSQSWSAWTNVIEQITENIQKDILSINQDLSKINSSFKSNKISNIRNGLTPLKIFFIGNSFAVQASKHIPTIFNSLNKKIIIGVSYSGGATLQYYDTYKETDAKQTYVKYKDGWVHSSEDNYQNTLMNKLDDEDWDMISMQQGSASSGLFSTYEPYYSNLLNWVNNYILSSGISYAWFMPWAWSDKKITDGGNLDGGTNNEEMAANILNATNALLMKYGVDLLIYNGIVVQKLLSEYTQDQIWLDGQHLADIGVVAVSLMTSNVLLKYYHKSNIKDVTYSDSYGISEEDFNKIKSIVVSCSYEIEVNGGTDYTQYIDFKSSRGKKYNITLVSLDNVDSITANVSIRFRSLNQNGTDSSNIASFSKNEIGETKQIMLYADANYLFIYTGFKDINAKFKLTLVE